MGRYIEQLLDGTPLPVKDKANFLAQMAGAKPAEYPIDYPHEDLVCVVSNHNFDAAVYIGLDEKELLRFAMPSIYDDRPRVWLLVPNAKRLAR